MRTPFTLSILLSVFVYRADATTWYVTSSGAGTKNGSSWANAASGNQLQSIINQATQNDEVWVATGTYKPTTGTDRTVAFSLKNGVSVLGSFAGTENTKSQRNLTAGLGSILSGEIGTAANSDNSYKILYNQDLDTTALIDGFILTGANDDRSPTNFGNGLGGGVYNHGFNNGGYCYPTVQNCLITNNRASWGAGAFNNGYNGGNASPRYFNCIFYKNHAYIEAGGMDSYGTRGEASPLLLNCIFDGNTSATNVGAMYAWGGNGGKCQPVLINCVFVNNKAQNGYCGAFIASNLDENNTTSSGTAEVGLRNCIVWNNTATGAGPQFYLRGTGGKVITDHCDIDTVNQGIHKAQAGQGELYTNPLFKNIANGPGSDQAWFTTDDGLQLATGSPCINAGSAGWVHTTDILGSNRILNNVIDMGAYESPAINGLKTLKENTVMVWPNPSSGLFYLSGLQNPNSSVKILDVQGREIKAKSSSQQNLLQLDLSGIANGLYFVENGSSFLKILKQ